MIKVFIFGFIMIAQPAQISQERTKIEIMMKLDRDLGEVRLDKVTDQYRESRRTKTQS